MTQETRAALKTGIDTNLASGIEITATALRAELYDVVDSAFLPLSDTLALSNGGLGVALTDPGADRIMFWDDSAGNVEWLTVGSGLSITGTTLAVSGAGTGDVVGPGSSTDNALARFDSTTGKLIQNSGAILDDSNNLSGLGTVASAAHTITSASANALAVGPNGTTNPTLQVDGSVASAATGVAITPAAAASGVTLACISSGTNEDFTVRSKGTGILKLSSNNTTSGRVDIQANGSTRVQFANTFSSFTPAASTAAGTARFNFQSAADTGVTAGTEAQNVLFNMSSTRQHGSNTPITLQRDFRVQPTTHSFGSVGGIIADAATVSIDGPPIGGTNATISNSIGLHIGAQALTNVTQGYGAYISAPTGATSNIAAQFNGAVFVIGELLYSLLVDASTAGSGSPNVLAAAGSGIVTTNEGTTVRNYNTLPAAAAGLHFTFIVQDADGMRITAGTGDTIRVAASVSTSGGYAENSTVGSVLTLVAVNATEWIATTTVGTWTLA